MVAQADYHTGVLTLRAFILGSDGIKIRDCFKQRDTLKRPRKAVGLLPLPDR